MKHLSIVIRTSMIVVVVILSFLPGHSTQGQAETKVECGTILESEFINNYEEHTYSLTMQARDSFSVAIESVGDHMRLIVYLNGPNGMGLTGSGWSKSPIASSGTLSARGIYKIRIQNEQYGVGLYTLYIGCVTSNGTIEPGDIPQSTPTPAPLPTATPRAALLDTSSTFTGTGFPGLAPVDFSSVAEIPLLLDTTMTGVIPTGNEILGFILDAEAGDTLNLSYTRVSGNMNLGLVVLSETNEVFFQASLVTSESLSTRFALPSAGKYTIGVFRISLVEPAEVEPTVFQLMGSLGAAE